MIIISNYNHIISSELIDACYDKDIVIYDQSQSINSFNADRFRNIIHSPHSGHNLSDYFSYIVSNWDSLPRLNRFIKGNIVPRHTDIESFKKRINNSFYTSLYNQQDNITNNYSVLHLLRFKSLYPSFHSSHGLHAEFNNNWYSHAKVAHYFETFDDLATYLFCDYKKLKYITFIPSGCSIVESTRIKYYPKELYEFLYHITTYTLFPREAYHVERILYMLWQCTYSLNSKLEFH